MHALTVLSSRCSQSDHKVVGGVKSTVCHYRMTLASPLAGPRLAASLYYYRFTMKYCIYKAPAS